MNKVLVAVIARNEAEALQSLLPRIPEQIQGLPVHPVLLSDGSSDSTVELGEGHGYPVIHFPENLGPSKVTRAGIQYASDQGFDYHISMDGDGQHDPAYLDRVVQELVNGGDLVVSSRFRADSPNIGEVPLDRRLLNVQVTAAVRNLTQRDFSDPLCGFRGHSRRLMDFLLQVPYATDSCPAGYGFPLESLLRTWHEGTFNIKEIPHPAIYNGDGKISWIYEEEFLDERLDRFKLHARHLVEIIRALGLSL